MKLYFKGHDNKYAAEQMLMTLFPAQRPEYPEGEPQGERCELTMTQGEKFATCSCRLVLGEGSYTARAAVSKAGFTDELTREKLMSRIVKLSFYRAALKAGVAVPEWGSLTGVRPAKLLSALLDEGLSEKAAVSRFRAKYSVSEKRTGLCLDAARYARAAAASLEKRDVCLYVGIPFCPTRCAYCSFVSQSVEKSMKLIEPYMDALMEEIEATAQAVRAADCRPVSLYMGGGTPTTLSAPQLQRLCTALETAFDLSSLREYTVEAGRPDTITAEKLQVLRAHGVGRISVNPQTMSDSVLDAIGRRHTAADIVSALQTAREVGGFEVNMDLIAGLPTDSAAGFEKTLDAVAALAPENITVHTLAMKKGSRLTVQGGDVPQADEVGRMLDYSMAALTRAGYVPYYLYRQKFMSGGFENVGWTIPGSENLYNICIMEELCSIISMGAGGSTKLTLGDGKIVRAFAPKYPLEYIGSLDRLRADKDEIKEFYNGI